MREYVIMADSSCDLTAAEATAMGITVLPLTFTVDGCEMKDTPGHAAMAPDEFFRRLSQGAACSTSAANVGQFHDAMHAALTEGKDVLCLCLSAALSTTYQSAVIAATELAEEFPEAKIHVIDSASAARGSAMLLYRIVKESEKEKDIDALADFAREAVKRQCGWFIVDDLNQLKRGGRISAMTALAGTALGIKPILAIDAQGALVAAGKVRGVKSAIKALVDKVEEQRGEEQKDLPIFISHADCPENVEYAAGLLRERFGEVEIREGYVGPVIGSHTGIGALGIFFVGDKA
ncbi:MAG: DegV family protein [Oscillospiraceae bacterium]|nr:DegV family protein [Oscillospiraceae bacterium]